MEKTNKYAWYALALLTLANISSFLDRQILSLLVKPIKRDLQLSDTQMSLLMGLSFALFYTFFGVLIGRLADRGNRRNIIMVGISVWSMMTALCAGVVNYAQFFLARMGVGIGESTLSPAAYSMIADLFPRKKLGLATSVFTLGIFFGAGVAMLIGAGIVANLPAEGMVHIPVFGAIFPWQLIFIYIGLPGLVIALLLFSIREPARSNTLQKDGSTASLSLFESVRIIFQHKKAYLLICFATAFQAMINYGCNAWIPTFVARTYGWEAPRAGFFYGVVLALASISGALFGGWYADRLVKKGVADGRLQVSLLGGLLCLAACGLPLLPKAEWALIAVFVPGFALAMPFGAAIAAVQEIMPNQVRALAVSILLFILNLIGMGLGPTFVAVLTDYLFKDENAIRYSMILLFLVGGSLIILFSWLALKPYRKAIKGVI